MKKVLFLPRLVALWLTLSLSLPSSAFAMRNENSREAGAEEQLRLALADPNPVNATAQVITRRLTDALGLPVVSSAPQPAAGAEEVQRLITELGDSRKAVRRAAVQALVAIGSGVIPDLLKALDFSKANVRVVVTEVVGQIGPTPDAVSYFLSKGLLDRAKRVRAATLEALLRVGPSAAEAVPDLLVAYAVQRKEEEVLQVLVEALRRIGPDLVPPAKNFLDRSDHPWWVRKAAVEALAQVGETAIPALIRALESSSTGEREVASLGLRRIGPAAMPAILAALKDPDDWIREGAVETLLRMDYPVSAVPALQEALHDSSSFVRNLAADALKKGGLSPDLQRQPSAGAEEDFNALADEFGAFLKETERQFKEYHGTAWRRWLTKFRVDQLQGTEIKIAWEFILKQADKEHENLRFVADTGMLLDSAQKNLDKIRAGNTEQILLEGSLARVAGQQAADSFENVEKQTVGFFPGGSEAAGSVHELLDLNDSEEITIPEYLNWRRQLAQDLQDWGNRLMALAPAPAGQGWPGVTPLQMVLQVFPLLTSYVQSEDLVHQENVDLGFLVRQLKVKLSAEDSSSSAGLAGVPEGIAEQVLGRLPHFLAVDDEEAVLPAGEFFVRFDYLHMIVIGILTLDEHKTLSAATDPAQAVRDILGAAPPSGITGTLAPEIKEEMARRMFEFLRAPAAGAEEIEPGSGVPSADIGTIAELAENVAWVLTGVHVEKLEERISGAGTLNEMLAQVASQLGKSASTMAWNTAARFLGGQLTLEKAAAEMALDPQYQARWGDDAQFAKTGLAARWVAAAYKVWDLQEETSSAGSLAVSALGRYANSAVDELNKSRELAIQRLKAVLPSDRYGEAQIQGMLDRLDHLLDREPPAAGAEETSAISVEVAEGMARMNGFLGRVGSDPSVLFGAGVHDLTESFGKSPEIEAFEREGVRPLLLVLPDRLSLLGASLDSPVLKLLVEPQYERAIREQLSSALTLGIVKITVDPSAARFVVGDRDFVQSQKGSRLVSRDATFLQVDPSTVGSLTQDFLTMVAAYKPGAVLVVGTQAEHADAVVLFESA